VPGGDGQILGRHVPDMVQLAVQAVCTVTVQLPL
jgi:hypothetical protein